MKNEELNTKILALLAEQIGVEVEDIELTDQLGIDLHMTSGDILDFIDKLSEAGIVDEIEISKKYTVERMLEKVASESLI